jgi:DNA-binding NtrC family response regulator
MQEQTVAAKRILVIEDEEDVRFVLDLALRSAGYEVDSVTSIADARSRIAARSYDLLVADNRLGDGSGMALADEVVERGVKAVIVSGYMFQTSASEVTGHDFLMKPVRPAELIEAVGRYIGPPRRS